MTTIIDGSGSATFATPLPVSQGGTSNSTVPAANIAMQAATPVFSVYQSASQTLVTATLTKVSLNTKEFDTAGAFDAVTNFRFQPLVAGYYQINGVARLQATLMTAAMVSLFKNGVEYQRGGETNIAAFTGVMNLTVSAVVFLNGSTDYMELFASVAGTSPTTIFVAQALTSRFSGALDKPT